MSSTVVPTPVLADLIPGARVRDVALTIAATAFLALAAQITVPLWFTPVPLSLSPFAILLIGASLGPARSATSTVLYLGLGLAGMPIFADQASGWAFASFGYIVGYIPAAVLVGYLARRRADRSLLATAGMASLGLVAIYAVGVPWLMLFLHVNLAKGLELGFLPFIAGDILKAVVAALILPGAWKLVRAIENRPDQ